MEVIFEILGKMVSLARKSISTGQNDAFASELRFHKMRKKLA